MTSNPDDPDRPYEYPSLEQSPAAPQPYAPVDPVAPYVPPPSYSPGPPPPPYNPGVPPPPPGYYPGVPPPAFPPPYHGGVPYDPYGKPQTTNAQAIGALVSSLVGAFVCCCGIPSLVGLILGIVAMNETKRTGQDGQGLALAGVIIGGIGLLFCVGFWLYFVLSPNGRYEFNY